MKEQQEVHDAIVALYARINEQKFYFRRLEASPLLKEVFKTAPETAGVDRDRTICALASKAATTFKAIRVLVEADLCDDAYGLCRVLLENSVYLAWMTKDDWISRVDTYGLSYTVNKVRLAKAVAEHQGDVKEAQQILEKFSKDVTLHKVSKAIFDDKHINWAVMRDPADPTKTKVYRLNDMLKEVDPAQVKPNTGHFAYAYTVFDTSQFVHSVPLGLRGYVTDLRAVKTYTIRQGNARRSLLAMALANTWMLVCIGALSDFLNAGLADDIAKIHEQLLASPGPTSADEE